LHHDAIQRYALWNSRLHHLEARAKIIAAVALIVICVSTAPQALLALSGYVALLALGILISRVPLTFYLRRALVIIPFAVMVAVFIPFIKRDNGVSYQLGIADLTVSRSGLIVLWNVLIKSFIAVLALTVLTATTTFGAMLEGLAQLKVPRVFVTMTGFAYRYLFVLIDELGRMKRARDARCYGGRWLWQGKVIGQMIGTFFLRSYERAERVYQAMIARGFDGKHHRHNMSRLLLKDYLFVIAIVGLCLALRIINQ